MPVFTATDPRGRTASASPQVFTTGPAPGLILTVVNGDVTINDAWIAANGNTLDRYWIKGHLIFTASVPFYVTRCIISGRAFPTPGSPPRTAIVHARSVSTPVNAVLHLTDTEVYPVQPDVNIVCLSGERIGPLTRVNLHGGSDLVNTWRGNPLRMESCWVHGFTFWANDTKHQNDPSRPFWSHNDGAQSSGCIGGYVRNSLFDMRADPRFGDYATLAASFPEGAWGSAIMLTGSDGYFDIEISGNWFGYGQAPVAMPLQSGGAFESPLSKWDVHHNVFWALPDPYGTSDYQLVRWGTGKGPLPSSVHDNLFTGHPPIPLQRRGTQLPGAVTIGSGQSGQYVVRV
jgi:hypothetical protein